MADAIYCRNGHFNGLIPEPTHRGRISPYREVGEEEYAKQLTRLAHCPKCGAENVFDCPHCEATIEYDEEVPGERPSYCSTCGKAFPWTEAALSAATEYTEEAEGLSAEEKTALVATFPDLTVDTPKTELAAHRFKKFLKKMAPDVAEGIRKTIVEIASETAVKLLRP